MGHTTSRIWQLVATEIATRHRKGQQRWGYRAIALGLVLLSAIWIALSLPPSFSRAASPDDLEDGTSAWLYLIVNDRGGTQVSFVSEEVSNGLPTISAPQLQNAVSAAVNCTLQDPDVSTDAGYWLVEGRCNNPLAKWDWRLAGEVNLTPLTRLLQSFQVKRLTVQLALPQDRLYSGYWCIRHTRDS